MHQPATLREVERNYLLEQIAADRCVELTGLSNMGKSTLLRSLRSAQDLIARYASHTGRLLVLVYIDCNAMLQLTDQALYELILRNLRETVTDFKAELSAQLERSYRQITEPETQFVVPLAFDQAMRALLEQDGRDYVLLLDEFDEAFDSLDGRVFLNLRALKDRYPSRIAYVTATVRRLATRRHDEATSEFVELSAHNTLTIQPLRRHEAAALNAEFAAQIGMGRIDDQDEAFLWEQCGGHPRLTRAAISHLASLRMIRPEARPQSLVDTLANDVTIRFECGRLLAQISPEEREALIAISEGRIDLMPHVVQALRGWGIVVSDPPRVFCRLLHDFIRRQQGIERGSDGIWLDRDAGEVWVDGALAPALTELEFKLMTLLFERANKLTDKYQIVEAVWGVQYIDDVDDARIEKLISRLRSKIEPEPAHPRYLQTMRGRGYKLALG